MKQRRYHIIIASIVFAILMWASINLGYEYTITKQIPVLLENMKPGTALKYPIPKSVTVRFRGHGWQLAVLLVTPDLRYVVDLSGISKEGFKITNRDLPEHLKLPVTVLALDVKPDSLLVASDQYREKKVPIIPQLGLTFRDGFGQVGPIQVSPESISIAGASSVIDSISQWYTVYERFDDRRTPIDDQILVDDPETYSIEFYPRAVRVRVEVQPFAEKTIAGIPVSALSVPMGREVIFVPPRMDVTVRAGIEQLARLTVDDFKVTAEFSELLGDSITTIIPRLTAPDGVRILKRAPERFQFFIRKRL